MYQFVLALLFVIFYAGLNCLGYVTYASNLPPLSEGACGARWSTPGVNSLFLEDALNDLFEKMPLNHS